MPTQSDTPQRRRAVAALRLPPLDCGCHDPLSREHLAHEDDDRAPEVTGRCVLCTSWGLERVRYFAEELGHCPCVEAGGAA